MRHFTSSQAKQSFGELLKAAESGPVAVEKHRKVQVIVATPAHFAASQQGAELKAERRLARLNQTLLERDRLMRHQKMAIDLLTMPPADQARSIARARAMVARWQADGLCSEDYIQRWASILNLPVDQMAQTMVSDADGWGTALRQNSPWVGQLA